ncbi:Leucine-twenty homeobox, partial [Microtus ochrogaster]
SELLDVCQTNLELGQPPWASMSSGIDAFVEMYALHGDDDPNNFDQYLFPGCHDGGRGDGVICKPIQSFEARPENSKQ